ncbi:MAG: hypothetical protein AAGU75_14260 [Bacillota bacterium]
MNGFPDILGMEIQDATALLEAEGLGFIIVETKPTKRELTEGVLRVIKVQPQITKSDEIEYKQSLVLTVCRI